VPGLAVHSQVDMPTGLISLFRGECYALMLTRHNVEAEDLVQEDLCPSFEGAAPTPGRRQYQGLVFTILRNIWLNQIRKGKSGPQIVDVDGEEGGADLLQAHARNSQEILLGKEDAEQIQIAIGPLSAEFREVILLREFEELSYQEIAVVLNCPAGTVSSHPLGCGKASR
jgi:RNA polymerase sigma-70 factor, ECF subfamily